MKLNKLIAASLVLAAQGGVKTVWAQKPDVDVKALLQRVEELEQKVKIQDRKRELNDEAAADKAKTAAAVSIGAGGLQIRSADTNFVLKLRGYVQADARFYPDDASTGTRNDTFLHDAGADAGTSVRRRPVRFLSVVKSRRARRPAAR